MGFYLCLLCYDVWCFMTLSWEDCTASVMEGPAGTECGENGINWGTPKYRVSHSLPNPANICQTISMNVHIL